MRVQRGRVAAMLVCALAGTAALAAEPAPRTFKTQMVRPGEGAAKAAAPAEDTIVQKRLSKAEARALLAKHLGTSLDRSGAAVTQVQHAHGAQGADLGEGFQHAQVMVRDADGTTRVVCVDSLDGAAAALADDTAAPGEAK